MQDYLSLKEAKRILGHNSTTSVMNLIDNGSLMNSIKINGKWFIPKEELESHIDRLNKKEYFNLKEAAKILNKEPKHLASLCKKGEIFPHAEKNSKVWKIPLIDIEEYQMQLEADGNEDYYTRKDISKLLGVQAVTATKLITKGEISNNIRKVKGEYRVPKNEFDIYLNKQRLYEEEYITLKEAAYRINKNLTAVAQNIEKFFPNAVKSFRGIWKVPLQDIDSYFQVKEYNSNIALTELLKYINYCSKDFQYKETLSLYQEFVRIQFNKMRGSISYIRDREGTYKKLFTSLKENLINEIYLLKVDEMEILLNNSKTKANKLLILRFTNYSYTVKGIDNDEKIMIDSSSNRKKNDTLYPPSVFSEIYEYVKKVELHKIEAIKNQNYANMWAYTLLLLTDFIRGADLILKTPIIDIQDLIIKSLEDLNSTNLTLNESHLIINQLYIHFRNKRASKNDEFLTFIVSPDLVVPLANALLISELHRRKNNNPILLNTLVSDSKFQTVYTSGLRKHKEFFNTSSLPYDFKFHSQTMNRSVATYLFFSIVEEDSENADLALTLTQNSRSHIDNNSTAIYVQLTNKDGYINRVSINLFRRGHFGWLYNHLILIALQDDNVTHTLEERTVAIEKLRTSYSPIQTEQIGQLFLDYTSTGDIERFFEESENDDYSKLLTEIYTKSNSTIERLKKYSRDEIKDIIIKLSKNDLPVNAKIKWTVAAK